MRPCTSRDLSQKRMLFQHSRKGLEWKILKYLINSNEAISDALARHLARLCLPFIWLENISNRCLPVCRRYYTVDPWLLPPGNPFKCHEVLSLQPMKEKSEHAQTFLLCGTPIVFLVGAIGSTFWGFSVLTFLFF